MTAISTEDTQDGAPPVESVRLSHAGGRPRKDGSPAQRRQSVRKATVPASVKTVESTQDAPVGQTASPQPQRKLQKWDGRRRRKVIPLPQAGIGPEGEEITATLAANHPMVRTMMGQDGWDLARAGTGEVLNEGAYLVVDGHLAWGDLVVYVRDAELDRQVRAETAADFIRQSREIGLPEVMLEGSTEVRTLAQSVVTTEGPPDD